MQIVEVYAPKYAWYQQVELSWWGDEEKIRGSYAEWWGGLRHQVDFEQLFEDGKMSEDIRNSVRSAVEFALMKAKPLMTRYHETLIQRSKEFADRYGVGSSEAGATALSSGQKNFQEWTQSYNARRETSLTSKSKSQSNKSKDSHKVPILEHQALNDKYSELQEVAPGSPEDRRK